MTTFNKVQKKRLIEALEDTDLFFKEARKDKKEETYEAEVEIFAVGLWNGMEFVKEDLMQISSAFHTLKENHAVPLKFGHNEDQPFTDGQPAIGWVDDVFIKEDKLVAKFVGIPEIVAKAISKGLYKNVSIELDMSVEHKGQHFPLVLSGVALLGADIPAVNTLEDLSVLMGRDSLVGESRKTFTVVSNKEGTDVTEKEAEKLKADLAAAQSQIEEDAKAKVTFQAENAKLKAEAEAQKKEAAEKESADIVTAFEAKLEALVKAEKLTPAKRESLMKGFDKNDVAGSIVKLEFAVSLLEEGSNVHKKETGLHDKETHKKDEGETPGEVLLSRVHEAREKDSRLDFQAAKQIVMRADKKLAREYIEENDGRTG